MSQEKNGENTDLECVLNDSSYCAETWILRKEDIARLEAFEIWIWHRMENISWTEHISKLTIIRTKQRNWMGHIMRGDSLQREILEGRMEGKREGEDQDKNY